MAEKIESEVKKIMKHELKFLKKRGVPPSAAYFHTPKGKFCLDHFDFRDKPKAIKLLREIADECEATLVVTTAHALMSKFEGSPSDPPYIRREVIFVYGETKNTDYGISQEYERKKNGQIKIGKKTIWPKGSIGPMTGFLYTKS